MREGKASVSAESTAALRALESMKPEGERICYDPVAGKFVRISLFRTIARTRLLNNAAAWYAIERRLPGSLGYLAARVRYVDDHLRSCLDDGLQQLVILGAGYDSRAYRIQGLRGRVRLFEVDHPATQRVKMEKVKKTFGGLPEHVAYVAVDFTRDELDRKLLESGYDRRLKTLFIWEGVTHYITAEAVVRTLDFVANNSGQGSSIIFDYTFRSVVNGTSAVEVARKARRCYARTDEPFTFGVKDGTIEQLLCGRGFCNVVHATADDLKRLYFKGPNRNRKILPYLPIVHATVRPRA